MEVEDLNKNKMEQSIPGGKRSLPRSSNKARLGKHQDCSVRTTTMRALEYSLCGEIIEAF